MAQQDDPYSAFGGLHSGATQKDDPYAAFGGSTDSSFSSYQPPSEPPPPDSRSFVDKITRNYDPIINDVAARHGVDPRLVKGVIRQESSGNPNAVSSADARGLMGVMPATAKGMGFNPDELHDPQIGIEAGTKYLAQLLDRNKGDVRAALTQYIGGFDPKNYGPQTQAYPDQVLNHAMRYNAEGESDFARGMAAGGVGTAADWYGEKARRALRAGNIDEATQALLEAKKGQQYIQDDSKTQDTLSNVSGPQELFDWAQFNVGQGLGSTIPALGYAATGGVLGSALGPVGTMGGALAGGYAGLSHQYAGNTFRGAVDEILNGAPATEENVRAAIGKLKKEDLDRIETAGLSRGAVEGAGDLLLGGVGKILPVGKAVDLLSTPLRRSIAGGASEAVTEAADVPLEAYGTGGEYTTKDILNSAGAGFVGGHAMSTMGNIPGAAAQTQGFFDESRNPNYESYAKDQLAQGNPDTLSAQQYGRQFYENGDLRQKTRSAIANTPVTASTPAENMPVMAKPPEAPYEPPPPEPIPSVEELHGKLLADWQVEADKLKPAKVTEKDYHAALEELSNNGVPADEILAKRPELQDFGTFKKWVSTQQKAKVANAQIPAKPTRIDAIRYREALVKQREKESFVGPNAAPSIEFAPNGAIDRSPEALAKIKELKAQQEQARKQTPLLLQSFGTANALTKAKAIDSEIEDALNKAEQANDPYEQEAWLNTAIAREKDQKRWQDKALDYMTEEEANRLGSKALFEDDKPEEAQFWFDLAAKKNPSPPSEQSLQQVNDAEQKNRDQVPALQQTAAAADAEKQQIQETRNSNFDALEAQQAAEKDAQMTEMERQKLQSESQGLIDESNRVPPSEVLINGEKAPTEFKQRPSETVKENVAAVNAQAASAAKHNTLAEKLSAAKEDMRQKAIAALRKQGAQIEDGDRLNWNNTRWELFPKDRRGRNPEGHFYADIFNSDGAKIGKVLRPISSTLEETNSENSQEQDETGNEGNTSNGASGEETRAVGEEGQQEAVDASQGQEVTPKKKPTRKESGKADAARESLSSAMDELDADPKFQALLAAASKPRKKAEKLDSELESAIKEAEDNESLSDDFEWFANGKAGARGVSRVVAEPIRAKLQKELGDRLGVNIKLYDSPDQVFREDANLPANTKGFYHSGANTIGVFVRALDSVRDLEETLNHELHGHFGLNTLTPNQKFDLLTTIARSLDNPWVNKAFKKVKTDQPHLANNDIKVAEEVFARAAEKIDAFWSKVFDAIVSKIAPVLRAAKLLEGKTSMAEIRQRAREIAKGIRSGESAQQTFPKDSQTQFSGGFNNFIDSEVKPRIQSSWEGLTDGLKDTLVAFNGISYLANWRPELKSLQAILKSELGMQGSFNEMADATQEQVDNIRSLPKETQKQLFKLMMDSTIKRIHPDRAFDAEGNTHLSEEAKPDYEALARGYNALPKAAQKAYQGVRDTFQKMHDQRKTALKSLAERLLSPKAAESVSRNLDILSRQSPGPYFPLVRFGDFIATWKSKEYSEAEDAKNTKLMSELKSDPKHYLVSFFDTRGAADRQVNKWIIENGGDRTDLTKSTAKEKMDFEGGVNAAMLPLLDRMKEALETTLGSGEQTREAKEALTQTFLQALPDSSIFMSSLKRENVHGVKADQMLQAIARHGASQAFHISRLEHSHDIQKALGELRNEDNAAMRGGEKVSVYGTVARGLTGLYTPDPTDLGSKAIGGAMSFLFYNRLALSPAFWITSALSPATVSIPYMGSRHNLSSAYSAWGTAAKDAAKILTIKGKNQQERFASLTRFSFVDQIRNAGLAADEIEMLKQVELAGGIDQSQIRELNSVARGGVGALDDSKRLLGSMAHRAEVLSRISTALTAYRLEKDRTKDADKAIEYAIDVVDKTLVNYTHAHTPFILRKGGALGTPGRKAVFQFLRYQIGMGSLILHNYREAFGSETGVGKYKLAKAVSPEQKEEARKKFYALLLVNAAVSGTGGMFGMSLLSAVAQMAANIVWDDDDEPDVDQKARKLADEIFGKTTSVAIRKGIPAAFGLDLSGRMGMSDMLNIRRENPFKGSADDIKGQLVDSVPSLSHAIDWLKWIKDPTMKSFPVSLISNAQKAFDLSEKGMTNTQGVIKKGAEDYGGADILFQALGFTPTESTEAYANQDFMRRTDKAISGARQKLINQWNEAMNAQDQTTLTEARKEIAAFNERHKGQTDVIISPNTLTKSRKQRLSREGRMNDQGVFIPKKGEWRQKLFTSEEE